MRPTSSEGPGVTGALEDRVQRKGPSSPSLQTLTDALNALVALLLERPITERKQVLLAIGQAVLPPSTRTVLGGGVSQMEHDGTRMPGQ